MVDTISNSSLDSSIICFFIIRRFSKNLSSLLAKGRRYDKWTSLHVHTVIREIKNVIFFSCLLIAQHQIIWNSASYIAFKLLYISNTCYWYSPKALIQMITRSATDSRQHNNTKQTKKKVWYKRNELWVMCAKRRKKLHKRREINKYSSRPIAV